MWKVLCSGWSASLFEYNSLSDEVVRYLHTFGFPVLTWIDYFYMTGVRALRLYSPEAQRIAALEAVKLALSAFHACGYFISDRKCNLEPVARIAYFWG